MLKDRLMIKYEEFDKLHISIGQDRLIWAF